MYWSAFILGLLGSTHCGLMCGPMSLSLPKPGQLGTFINTRLLYNFGRVFTYMFIGLIFSQLRLLVMSNYQEWLSVGSGLLIMALSFTVLAQATDRRIAAIFTPYIYRFRRRINQLIGNGHNFVHVITGIFNGFLPCGLVYIALLGSIDMRSNIDSVLYMFTFGIGTFPMMLSIALLGFATPARFSPIIVRMTPIFTFTLGLMLVIRGLHLDIPYLSPALGLLYPDLSTPTICQ